MAGNEDCNFVDQRELRSNRSQKFMKPTIKEDVLVKKVVTRHIEQADVDKIASKLPKDNCGEWNNSVYYSMRKKGRWRLIDNIRSNIESWNDHCYDEDFDQVDESAAMKPIVSVLERRHAWTQRRHSAALGVGYHGMEEDDEGELVPVHRYPIHTYGNEATLTTKPRNAKPKRTKVRRTRNDRRPVAPVDETEIEPSNDTRPRLQYEVTAVQDEDKFKLLDWLWKNEKRSIRRSRGHRRRNRGAAGSVLDEYLDDEDLEFDESEDEFESAPEPDTNQDQQPDVEQDSSNESIDLLSDIDQDSNSEEFKPLSKSMTVNLTDLAFLQCVQAENRNQRRLQRQKQTRRRYHTENDVSLYQFIDDEPGTSGISNRALSESEDTPVQIAAPTGERSVDDYFEIIPAEVLCPADTIGETYLRQTYADAYYECSCVPRRFVIDISRSVKDSLQAVYGEDCQLLNVQMSCVCEVIPPTVLIALLDEDERASVAPMKVWVNGTFPKGVRSVYVDTINPCIAHTIEEIVESVIKMAVTLPLDYYQKDSGVIITSFSTQQAPVRLFSKPVAVKYLDRSNATAEVLEQENMMQKLQRQITAVKRYDWFSNVGETICSICLDWPVDEIGFCLSQCHHWFCTKCWRSYCMERIMNGLGPLTCPYPKCTASIDYFTLTTFVPLAVCQTYMEQLRDQCISKNSKQWTWCPNTKCGRLIQLAENPSVPAVICVCGYFWCAQCSNASHWPASCEHAQMYVKKLRDRQDDPTLCDPDELAQRKIHRVEVKRCPHCKIMMEKGEGCICMTCRCGKNFCWACGGAWSGENHTSCYAKKKISGFLTVRLIDVGKEPQGELGEYLYERSLTHRLATRPPHVTKLKQAMLTKCWNTSRRIQRLALNNTTSFAGNDSENLNVNEQSLRRRILAVSSHVQEFLEIQRQAHYLLEFVYVHLQYCNKKTWANLDSLKWTVDRLEFALDRMEESCKNGDLRKVDEFMVRVKNLLKILVKEVWLVKFAKDESIVGEH